MVSLNLREVNERILLFVMHKDIGQGRLANFALKLAPIDASKVWRNLSIFFCLEPALQTQIVYELYAAPTLTDLQQGILIVKLTVPAQSALRVLIAFIIDVVQFYLFFCLVDLDWANLLFLLLCLLYLRINELWRHHLRSLVRLQFNNVRK